jgi:hypothetical protein
MKQEPTFLPPVDFSGPQPFPMASRKEPGGDIPHLKFKKHERSLFSPHKKVETETVY